MRWKLHFENNQSKLYILIWLQCVSLNRSKLYLSYPLTKFYLYSNFFLCRRWFDWLKSFTSQCCIAILAPILRETKCGCLHEITVGCISKVLKRSHSILLKKLTENTTQIKTTIQMYIQRNNSSSNNSLSPRLIHLMECIT